MRHGQPWGGGACFSSSCRIHHPSEERLTRMPAFNEHSLGSPLKLPEKRKKESNNLRKQRRENRLKRHAGEVPACCCGMISGKLLRELLPARGNLRQHLGSSPSCATAARLQITTLQLG